MDETPFKTCGPEASKFRNCGDVYPTPGDRARENRPGASSRPSCFEIAQAVLIYAGMNAQSPDRTNIAEWLIGEGRLLGDGVAVVEQFAQRLTEAGVPLWRLRVAQRMANPLLSAWGVIWRSDGAPTEDYVVPTAWLDTSTWIGSPFKYVTENRVDLRKTLTDLDPERDHGIFHELAAEGGTDFYCMALEYGDGEVQGTSIATNVPGGFTDEQIALFASLKHPLAAAMEPIAMRRSLASLLKTYLGEGPSRSVVAGTFRRGEISVIKAVVMMTDMRDFTAKSAAWSEEELLKALGQYFEVTVGAVHAHGGDVLKFLGDGLLAVFPIEDPSMALEGCKAALAAALDARDALAGLNTKRAAEGDEPIDFGTALHLGQVTYGNIGSPDRLDFTVIGQMVNVASRIEGLTKTLAEPILMTQAVANHLTADLKALGTHTVRGLETPMDLYAPA